MLFLYTFIGSLLGLVVGTIPGLSVTMATALLLGLTYSWPTHHALATIMGVYVVGVFSGAISAILINVPGAPSALVTTLDGHPMAKKGEGADALFLAVIYSFVGSLFGLLALALFAKPLSIFALSFRTIDYFLLAFFALSALMSLSGGKPKKAILAGVAGILFSLVGLDPITGTHRFTFGIRLLMPGIPLVPVLLGFFGLGEAIMMLEQKDKTRFKLNKREIKAKEALSYFPFSLYYALLGTLVGILPGAGTPVASFLSYSQAAKRTKNPKVPFGQGAREGIIAPEAANNACVGGALIPMLSLGIPGDGVSAIILSVFMVHGLKPGPLFMMENYDTFLWILKSGLVASVFLLILGLSLAPYLGFIFKIKNSHLAIFVIVLSFFGAYSYNYRSFDLLIMVFFGFLSFVFKRYKIPMAPLVLGLVLGPMMDSNFRRSVLLMGREGIISYIMYPITLFFLGLILLLFLYPQYKKRRG